MSRLSFSILQSFQHFEKFAELVGSFERNVAILEDHEILEMAVGGVLPGAAQLELATGVGGAQRVTVYYSFSGERAIYYQHHWGPTHGDLVQSAHVPCLSRIPAAT